MNLDDLKNNINVWLYGKLNTYYRQKNKVEFVEQHGFVTSHKFSELSLLAVYYSNDKQLKDKILSFCRKYFKDFNEVKYNTAINKIIDNTKKNKPRLKQIDSIPLPIDVCKRIFHITKNLNAPYVVLQKNVCKTLFALVCLSYLEYTLKPEDDKPIYIYHSYSDLKKTSGITSFQSFLNVLRFLQTNNIIKVCINGVVHLTTEFLNNIGFFNVSTNNITVIDYDNLYRYATVAFDKINNKNPHYKHCRVCGHLFTNTRNGKLYCQRCAKIVKNYQNVLYYKNKHQN